MRLNYRKIASVLASAAMLSSTIGLAAAANYPTPFTDGTAVVYGTNAASSDIAAAIDVFDQLKTRTSGSSNAGASVSGEAKAVETSSQPLYLGDIMNATKATFTKDQLPTVLADGTVTDDNGADRDYQLKIGIPNTNNIFGTTVDSLSTPIIFSDFGNSSSTYTLRVVFPTSINMSLLTDESIKLFGKEYVFSGRAADLTNTSVILFDKSTSVIVNDGESVTAEGHTISVAVEDADTAAITIDGVTESHDEGFSGKIGGVDIYIKNVVGPNVAGTSRYAEVYLNSNKITLTNADNVVKNSEDVQGTLVYFTGSAGKVSEIGIITTPYNFDESVKYLKIGDSFTDPTFGTVKFALSNINPDLTSSDRDLIQLTPSSDTQVALKFTNRAGKAYDINVLRTSKIGTLSNYTPIDGIGANISSLTYNLTTIGYDTNGRDMITSTAAVNAVGMIDQNDYFITCSNDYTQIWQLTSVQNSSEGKVKVVDQGEGSTTVTISLSGTAPGSTGTFTLGDGSSITVTLANSTAINITSGLCNYLYTKKGAKINLARANAPTNNASEIIIEEETAYNGGSFTDISGTSLGRNVSVRFAYNVAGRSGKDMFVRDAMTNTAAGANVGTVNINYWTGSLNNGNSDTHWLTKYGTFVTQVGGDDDVVSTYYSEDAAKLGFYVGEVSSEITPGTTGSSGGQISVMKDSEAGAVADKHLIVVGGSCVNTVAAKLLGSSSPVCGDDFTAKTKVGAGGYIVKSFESPYNANKVAMLVAGYEAADTVNAVKRAMVIDGVTTDKGSEEIFPVVS